MSSSRQLAAIMFTDIVGYTAIMGSDEQKAFELLDKSRQIQKPIIEQYNGKWIKELGDGVMTSFNTVSDAVNAAIKIQEACNAAKDFQLSIGIHQGEIIFEDNDIYGDAVNIASRIQSLGIPGSILFSKKISDEIRNKSEFQLTSLGTFEFKNVDEPIEVFALSNPGFVIPKREQMKGKLKQSKKKARLLVWITSIVFLAVSVFAISYFLNGKQAKSMAVLPFEDLSPGHDQEYLGDGIATNVHMLLSHLKELKLTGLTSSFSFKEKKLDLVTIGKSLKVKYLLEGNVQRIGNNIKINVALINATDGTQIWAQPFNIQTNDNFDVQDKIAQSIVEKINVRMTDKEKQMLVSTNTTTSFIYEDYLKGQHHLYQLTPLGIDSAAYYFTRVLQKDTNFAQAHAAMADLWTIKMQQGLIHFTEGKKRVEEAAQKAQKLDPNIADVHYSLGLSAWLVWDWPSLTKELYHTIQIQPNHAKAHIYLSNFQHILGNPNESKFHSNKALELEPKDPLFTSLYSMNLMYEGQNSMAVQILENNLRNFPGHEHTINTLRTAYHLTGQHDSAFATWRKYFSIKNDKISDSVLTSRYHDEGYHKALQRLAEFYVSQSKRAWSIATLYTRAGMKEQAIEWLYKAFDEHDLNMPYLKVDPIFNFLKNDTRYKALLKKLNLKPD